MTPLLDDLRRLVRDRRLAHAHVIQGDPLLSGKLFAVDLLTLLFEETSTRSRGNERHRIETRAHPDILWVEPAGKLQQIKAELVEDALKRIQEKSYEGGWKAVVFLSAERLNPTSGNRLLKTLEEPPPNTLILLVTESPEKLLATLRSRCQLLIAPRVPEPPPFWEADLVEILRQGPPRNLQERLVRAAAFRDLIQAAAQQSAEMDPLEEEDGEEEEISSDGDAETLDKKTVEARENAARRKLTRKILAGVEAWYRDVLVVCLTGDTSNLRHPVAAGDIQRQAESLKPSDIFRLLENAADIARGLESNTPVQVVLESAVI